MQTFIFLSFEPEPPHLSTKSKQIKINLEKKIYITKNILQMFSRDFYMPFFESSLVALPQRLQTSLPLLPILNTVVSVLLTIPACVTINKYGKLIM